MDQLDIKILKLLEGNCRIPVKEISERINLTSPAVSERIKRLEQSGVIQGYHALLSHEKLGYGIRAIVSITMRPEHYNAFFELAKKNPSIIECYHVTGAYSISVKVVAEGVKELELLLNQIQKFGDTNTQIILSSPFGSKGYIK